LNDAVRANLFLGKKKLKAKEYWLVKAVTALLFVTVLTGWLGARMGPATTWVKCRNPACEAEYQIDTRKYYEYIEKHADPSTLAIPPLVCEKCGEESVYQAVKCEKCALVFERGWKRGDYEDRCPDCDFSKIEEMREKRREEKANKGQPYGFAKKSVLLGVLMVGIVVFATLAARLVRPSRKTEPTNQTSNQTNDSQ
jgi:predicted Zn-ribbon and HTH transcriptional regulator